MLLNKWRVTFLLLLLVTFISTSIPFPSFVKAQTDTTAAREAELRAELARIEQEQAETQKILQDTQKQSSSIERDLTLLNARNKAAQLEIQKKNLLIQNLGSDIVTRTKKIETLQERITRGEESLAQLMRKTNEIDSYTIPEIVLTNGNLTDIMSDLDNFDSIQISLKSLFASIRADQDAAEREKKALGAKQDEATDAKMVIQGQKKEIEKNQASKKTLLAISKNEEKTYEQLLAEKKKKAAQIRAALFALRDTAAIPFAKALEYANKASEQTGIRPAFLLAILTQESALGKNVGSCYLTDKDTGAGIGAKSGTYIKNVMKPSRDVGPFLKITSELGIDPYKTLVSCPQSIGWGGAMGPAQFIPSTWEMFAPRIATLLHVSTPDPWRPEDAFMASAIYLTDLGAKAGSYTGERNAACKYYSGSSCKKGSINSTYGDQVMNKALNIQDTMINPLQGV